MSEIRYDIALSHSNSMELSDIEGGPSLTPEANYAISDIGTTYSAEISITDETGSSKT